MYLLVELDQRPVRGTKEKRHPQTRGQTLVDPVEGRVHQPRRLVPNDQAHKAQCTNHVEKERHHQHGRETLTQIIHKAHNTEMAQPQHRQALFRLIPRHGAHHTAVHGESAPTGTSFTPIDIRLHFIAAQRPIITANFLGKMGHFLQLAIDKGHQIEDSRSNAHDAGQNGLG